LLIYENPIPDSLTCWIDSGLLWPACYSSRIRTACVALSPPHPTALKSPSVLHYNHL
jgi:hypothetical protein